eukprot:COSAG03_NODE_1500_length_3974_cov_33.983226_2_plen_72_part_00
MSTGRTGERQLSNAGRAGGRRGSTFVMGQAASGEEDAREGKHLIDSATVRPPESAPPRKALTCPSAHVVVK